MNTISLTLRKSLTLQWLMLLVLLPGLILFPVPVKANPSGANVVAGNVTFQGMGTSSLDINNMSQNAIINWQSFSIQQGEVTRINQGPNAFTLNRVTSGNPTAIYGALQAAQGGVMVINPNGIVVHQGGTIDVAGMLTLSTLDIKNEDFLDRGSNRFTGTSTKGIKNYGAITSDAGDVVMLGNFLQNAQGGSVTANRGVVAFGAGGDMLVEQTVSGSTISVLGGGGGDTGIQNSGTITGAAAELKATGNVYSLAIQNDGVVRANGYNFKGGRLTLSGGSTGSVVNTGQLYARNADGSGGRVAVTGGNVNIGGTVDVSGAANRVGGSVAISGTNVDMADTTVIDARGSGGGTVSITGVESAGVNGSINASGDLGNGGQIDATAESLTIGSNATMDVSGVAAGGTVRAGGGYQGKDIEILNAQTSTVEAGALVIADSSEGDAGNVFIWADGDTFFGGEVSARATGQLGNGGFVEVSGAETLKFRGTVSTLSAGGANGTLLLDPTDVTIGDAAQPDVTISDADLVAALLLNNVVVHTSSTGGDPGDILVLSNPDRSDPAQKSDLNGYTSANTLSFFAHGSIVINDSIQNRGTGGVILFAGWDGTGAGSFSFDPVAGTIPAVRSDPAVMASDIRAGTYGAWGQNEGDITINGSGLNEVMVGSAFGETALFGNRISLLGGDFDSRSGQIGFRDATLDPTGAISLYAKDDIVLDASRGAGNARNDSFVQVGHGGSNNANQNSGGSDFGTRSGDGDLSGDIVVVSDGGGLFMRGGNDRSYSQIGHGGHDVQGDKDGNITVVAGIIDMRGGFLPSGSADGTNRAGTRIGHGGYDSYSALPGSKPGVDDGYSGDIYVKSTTSIYGQQSFATTNGAGANTWQIGHGGYRSGVLVVNELEAQGRQSPKGTNDASELQVAYDLPGHTGAIYVEAGGNITVNTSSRGNAGAVQIGHGGRDAYGNHNLTMASTGNDYTAGLKDGITLISGGDITFDRFNHPNQDLQRPNSDTPIHIGLGGLRAAGRMSGDIDIRAAGSFEVQGGHDRSYAQVGHGGYADGGNWNSDGLSFPDHANGQGHATLSGNISLVAGGDVGFYAGGVNGASNGYTQLGHGGFYRVADGLKADGSVVDAADAGHHGNIFVSSGGNVTVSSKPKADDSNGLTVAGNNNYAMIGHGGYRSNGDHYGRVDIGAAGDVRVESGYGGWEEYRPANDDYRGSQTGVDNFSLIGHGGFQSTLYRDLFMGQVSSTDTRNRWTAMYQYNGNEQGKGIGSFADSSITITSTGGGLDVIATQQAGALRNDHFDANGIPANYTDTNFTNISMAANGAIGGGANGTAATVVVENNLFRINRDQHGLVTGQTITISDLADINGGAATTVTVTRINANSFRIDGLDATGVTITDQEGSFISPVERPLSERTIRQWAQVGHGGYGDNDGNRRMTFDSVTAGDISINVAGALNLMGGGQEQIDNTRPGLSNTTSGNGNNNNGGDLNRIEYNHAMIGHGGQFFRSSYDGNITVNTGGDISVAAGKAFREFARIGHGGYESGITPNSISSTTVEGHVTVTSVGNISLLGGNGVNVNASGGDIQFNYSQIGHGAGNMGLTVEDQNITVAAGGNINLSGGLGIRDSYAHIGHGALNNGDGDFSGVIDVSAGGNLTLTKTSDRLVGVDSAGNDVISARNYVKIGHGDSDSAGRTKSNGEWNGDINVKVGDNLVSTGGRIGHIDPTNSDDILTSRSGNTYIAVGRNSPLATGGGDLITDADTVFTSSKLGVNSELRLYLPAAGDVDNFIAEGTNLNGFFYTRDPFPGGSRADESLSTDFTFAYSGGLPTGDFLLDAAYSGSSFGNYRIYYSSFLIPDTGGNVGGGGGGGFIPVIPLNFSYFPYLFEDFFDAFDRNDELYDYDGYEEGLLAGLSTEEMQDDESPVETGGWFLEEALDGAFGSRRAGQADSPDDPTFAEEDDEERRRRLLRASRQVGRGGNAVYVYNPGTNRYSSLRLFGVPAANVR